LSTAPQTTDAQLSDGTTLRFQGQLSPDEVRAKVAAFRASKAQKIQQAKPGDDTGIVDPRDAALNQPEQPEGFWHSLGSVFNLTPEAYQAAKIKAANMSPVQEAVSAVAPHPLDMAKSAGTAVASEFSKGSQEGEQGLESAQHGDIMGALAHFIGQAGHAGATAFAPVAGESLSKAGEQFGAGNIKGGAGTATGLIAPMLVGGETPKAAETGGIFLKPGLMESSHRMLSDAATKTKQLVGGTVHQNVSQHFGRLADDVAAADYAESAKTGKKIDLSDIWESVLKHADDYAAGKTTPNFNAISDAIQKRPVEVSFKELHDLSKEVGQRWDKAQTGTRDAGAATQALNDIRGKLDARAKEVGRGQQWDAAKAIWSTLKEYEGNGALNKLLNTPIDPVAPGGVSEGGKQFFDQLRDPANQAKFKEINKALEPYGMPENYFTDLAKSHAPLHNMVAGTASGGGIFGRTKAALRAVKENPAVGIPAVATGTAVGSALGGPIGGTVGAIAGLKGVERISAANAVRKLGGVPPEVNPMAEASKVKPVGASAPVEAAPVAQQKPMSPKAAPVPTVNEDEVVSALNNLGYPRKTARSMAQAAIQDNPHDFDAALKQAISGKSVSGAKAETISETKPESGTYVRPSQVTPQKIADQVKAAKSGQPDTRADVHKAQKADMEKETAVTSAKVAAGDTADFQQAKKELPNASISEQLKRAQEIKDVRKAPISDTSRLRWMNQKDITGMYGKKFKLGGQDVEVVAFPKGKLTVRLPDGNTKTIYWDELDK